MNCRRDVAPLAPPLRFAVSPPGWVPWVLTHPRNEPLRDLNSPAGAEIHSVAERVARMGGGRFEGANPGPLPPQGSALPGCATARMNFKSYPFFRRPESLNCRRDVRPLRPTPTQSGMPLRGSKKLHFAPDLRPTHPPLRFAVSPPGWRTWVLAHPRNEPGTPLPQKFTDCELQCCACPDSDRGYGPNELKIVNQKPVVLKTKPRLWATGFRLQGPCAPYLPSTISYLPGRSAAAAARKLELPQALARRR